MWGTLSPSIRHRRIMLLAAASALALNAAVAQDQGTGQGSTALEAVVVEGGAGERGDGPVDGYVAKKSLAGTKTDTPVSKTPQTVSVVSKEQIEDQSAQSVAEALRYTPGVLTDYRGASNLRDELFVRGFYYVPKYLDGLFLGGDLSYAKIDPYLLERVELISGPASVLYGQANPGGIVNMVSKKPTDTPLRAVELSVGTDKYLSAGFDISDTFDDAFGYRIAAKGLGRDLQEDYARNRSFAIAPSFTWSPDEGTSLTILGGYQKEPDAGYRNFLDAAGTVTPIPGFGFVPRDFFVSDPDFERSERKQAWIGYEFKHEFNDNLTFRQNARYHHVDWLHHTLVYGSAGPDPVTGNNTIVSRSASGGTDTWNQFTVDNQLEATFSTGAAEHTLLGGVDFQYRTRDYKWGRAAGPSIDLADPRYGDFDFSSLVLATTDLQDLTARQAGVYLQDQVEIGALNLLAGIRYDRAKTEIDDRLGTNDQSYEDGAFTWRAGALYAFDNGLSPYVSYATSFEPALYMPPAGASAFSPTTAEQFEVGVKYAPEGSGLLLTAAYYDLRQKDVVAGAWDPDLGQTVYSQVGKIHNRGIELSARAEVTNNLSLIAGYSYIDSIVKESVNTSEVGKMPSRIPQHQASLWATYTADEGALEGLTVGGGLRYIGTSWGDGGNSFKVGAVTLFDAMASYDFGAKSPDLKGLSLQLNVKNIGDERYVASCASAYACFYGEGRSIVATLKKEW
ncbi:TonB-dependent receptor [Shinella sp. SUS2]|uniref:TonB-dependent siderophore receptor n=1 Tax=unclassified Shinella TaxID=2643062 RepID=UPI00067FA3BF|nr:MULTISPECIES: TonB-dependent siderophore receptor [unclassified Shinella]KNY15463.1 TonB-dependent receptor [Shinella sp. SUS2]KOC76056.1 TonB-dependent receptor [Shinella sp. GWS1]